MKYLKVTNRLCANNSSYLNVMYSPESEKNLACIMLIETWNNLL